MSRGSCGGRSGRRFRGSRRLCENHRAVPGSRTNRSHDRPPAALSCLPRHLCNSTEPLSAKSALTCTSPQSRRAGAPRRSWSPLPHASRCRPWHRHLLQRGQKPVPCNRRPRAMPTMDRRPRAELPGRSRHGVPIRRRKIMPRPPADEAGSASRSDLCVGSTGSIRATSHP